MTRILLIDDDEHLRVTLKIALERAGHDVQVAVNGEDGLDFMKTHEVDILVTDLLMPVKEGIETIIEARKSYPDLKIVAMSGGGRTGNIRFLDMAMELGASQTLAKPFAMKALVDCVRELTDGA
jgi:DNA-binding NtrC family response regulator